MAKTNKVVAVFRYEDVGFPLLEDLKRDFEASKEFDNDTELPDKEHTCSLLFLAEEDQILFFQMSRWDQKNITVSDHTEKTDHKSFLKKNQKVKATTFFALLPKHRLLLALFNHKAFSYSVPTLIQYFEAKSDITLTIHPITRKPNDEEMRRYLEKVKHITFTTASQEKRDFKSFENDNKELSLKEKLRKYTEKEVVIFTLQRLQHFKPADIWKLIQLYREKKQYDKIIISGNNFGEVDILEELSVSWACNVRTDDDDHPLFEDFRKEIKRIVEEKKGFLSEYV